MAVLNIDSGAGMSIIGNRRSFLGLQASFQLGIFVSLAVFAGIFFFERNHSFNSLLEAKTRTIPHAVSTVLAQRVNPYVINKDTSRVQDVLDGMVISEEIAVAHFLILNGDGEMTEVSTATMDYQQFSSKTGISRALDGIHEVFIERNKSKIKPYVFVTLDIPSGDLGADFEGKLVLGLDLSNDAVIHINSLAIGFLFFYLVSIIAIYVSLKIGSEVIQPIRELLSGMRRMEDTNFTRKPLVPVSGHKELAELILRYNNHADTIIQGRRRLRNNIEAQDSIILERTLDLEMALAATEKSAQGKSDLINIISHELKQPIYAAKISLANMRRQHDFMNARSLIEYADQIDKGLNRASKQINDVLEFSRSDIHESDLDPESMDLYQKVEESVFFIGPQAHQKGLTLDLIVGSNLPNRIKSNPRSIDYIISNLLDNAIKYTDEGGVTISLSMADSATETPQLVISVKDTGIGISHDEIKRIFEPFYRSDKSDPAQKGHGVGLSIALNHILNLSGTCVIEPYEGGTEFLVKLPLVIDPDVDGMEQSLCKKLIDRLNIRIGIIHERPSFIEAMAGRFANMGAEIITASCVADMSDQILSKPTDKITAIIVGGVKDADRNDHDERFEGLRVLTQGPIISLEDTHENLDAYPEMLGGDVDFSMNSTTSIRNILHKIKFHMEPQKELLHSIFMDNSLSFEKVTLKNMRLLLIDDDKTNLEYTAHFLRSYGAEVIIGHGAKSGLEKATMQVFDAIFLDVMMPEMDGFQVAHLIRSDEHNAKTPLFAFTAANLNESQRMTMDHLDMILMDKADIDNMVMLTRAAVLKAKSQMQGHEKKVRHLRGV